MTRWTGTLLLALATGALLTGCTPDASEPTPTPTLSFSSDEDAFAAAEATYRAYVDALNEARADDAASPAPIDFLSGEALETELETARQLDALGLTVRGDTRIAAVTPVERTGNDTVTIEVCLDSADTMIYDTNGDDVTPPTRETRLRLTVDVTRIGDTLAIARSDRTSEEPC
ncbi:hypothetical protein A8L33_09360 [Microbacterium aurantiacum]|uniref:Uncharacterized protein n=2 Tax=Microbacterium aurantiacum TaxID=162393 RepID=A0A0M8MJE0_9MICO|nr:hypothetical protein A8L33_09360 [Microbacterium chocolatum]KOS11307.1 hypothetical protein XI38_05455 [Microbacterium chocolatum]